MRYCAWSRCVTRHDSGGKPESAPHYAPPFAHTNTPCTAAQWAPENNEQYFLGTTIPVQNLPLSCIPTTSKLPAPAYTPGTRVRVWSCARCRTFCEMVLGLGWPHAKSSLPERGMVNSKPPAWQRLSRSESHPEALDATPWCSTPEAIVVVFCNWFAALLFSSHIHICDVFVSYGTSQMSRLFRWT